MICSTHHVADGICQDCGLVPGPGERTEPAVLPLCERIQDAIDDLDAIAVRLELLHGGDHEALERAGGLGDARERLASVQALCDALEAALAGPRRV